MTTALLVIDMQNAFCHPDGSGPRAGRQLYDLQAAITGCVSLVAQARENRLPTIFTRTSWHATYADARPQAPIRTTGGLVTGTWDVEIIEPLVTSSSDLVIDKTRQDAFFNTPLDHTLRSLGVDHVVACGVVTNMCVESSVRSAFMRNYSVTVVADACAARSERLQQISLEVMEACDYADVCHLERGYALPR